jgi:hypothetical protein
LTASNNSMNFCCGDRFIEKNYSLVSAPTGRTPANGTTPIPQSPQRRQDFDIWP